MKIAFYMQDGLRQIVLTPESEEEKSMLGHVHDNDLQLAVKKGSFFKVRGGWVRHGVHSYSHNPYGASEQDDESTILVLTPKPVAPAKEHEAGDPG